VIPASFEYARPTTVDEALQAIADGGDDVKIMAGGQSLIPVMTAAAGRAGDGRRPQPGARSCAASATRGTRSSSAR
jgi:hypothetical protein